MKKYKFKTTPPIGDNEYLSTIKENDSIIEETVEEIFNELPSTIKIYEDKYAYLNVKKISNTCWFCSYKTWKDVYHKDFEMIDILYTQAPSLKVCLYNMYFEVEKWLKKTE